MTITAEASDLIAVAHALCPNLRDAAVAIDRDRRLPDELVERMVGAGLPRMLVPRDVGGLQVDPITATRVVETISAANGSAGWVLMIMAGTAHWAGCWLPYAAAEQAFGADPRAVLVGSAVPVGRAERVNGGYRLSGRFPFASGSVQANWIGSGCFLYENGQPVKDAADQPVWAVFVAPASAVALHDTWNSLGLRGTSSHDYTMADIFVPDGWQFNHLDTPRVPDYASVACSTCLMSAVALGIAQAALDAMLVLATAKPVPSSHLLQKQVQSGHQLLRDDEHVQAEMGRAGARLGAARTFLYQALADRWAAVQALTPPTRRQRSALRLATAHAVTTALDVVDAMHALAGSSAVYATNPIERNFRDIHTAATHAAMRAPQAYVTGGQLLLDLEPRRGYF